MKDKAFINYIIIIYCKLIKFIFEQEKKNLTDFLFKHAK